MIYALTGRRGRPDSPTGPCVTALRHLDSNQEGRINSPFVYRLTDAGSSNAVGCLPVTSQVLAPGLPIAAAGGPGCLRGGGQIRTGGLRIMSPEWYLTPLPRVVYTSIPPVPGGPRGTRTPIPGLKGLWHYAIGSMGPCYCVALTGFEPAIYTLRGWRPLLAGPQGLVSKQ